MKIGLARRKQEGIIVAQTIDGPSSKAGDKANQAIFTSYPRGPSKFVVRECNPRVRRQEVVPNPSPHHFLNHDSHFFVEIRQPMFRSVLDRVRAEYRCVHLCHCIRQCNQALLPGPLIGNKEALVLSGKGGSHTIFEEESTRASLLPI